ncbi:uncharacterized protein LOC116430978 [Nomia melanderi]|uniref:uncharacterized protein LOC116430978 n=1 Tax=Nomia melanderi TaxID=2448451 RepID=UPI003FCDC00E
MANIPTFNAAIKLLVLLYCRKDLQPLVKSFYDDWYTLKTKEDRTTMLNSANLSRFLSIWCSVLTAIMVSSYIFLRSFLICRYNITAEPQYRLSIYPAYYPFDMRPTLVRVIVNVAQVFGAYCGAVPYTGVDNFIAMLVLHICGQFQNLKRKLTRLMDGQRKPKEIQVELAWIVQRHEHLNWAASRIEDCFNQLLLWQLLLCTIEICFQGFSFYNVLFVSETGISAFQTIFFTLFILFVIVHVYLYCYVGELLRVHSSSMAIAAYESNWYNVAPSEAKCLLFIMLRSTRPLRLTAGKFSTFSMEMFNTVSSISLYTPCDPKISIHSVTHPEDSNGLFVGSSYSLQQSRLNVPIRKKNLETVVSVTMLSLLDLLLVILTVRKFFKDIQIEILLIFPRYYKPVILTLPRMYYQSSYNCDNVIDLREAIGWNRLNLHIIGIWPEPMVQQDRLADFRAFVAIFCTLMFVTIWQSINLFRLDGDLGEITQTLTLANIPGYNAAIKIFVVWYLREDLKPLIKSFYNDWYAPKTDEERTTMMDSAKLSKYLSIWCTILTQCMVTAYISIRSFTIAGSNATTERQDHLVIYPGYYPFDMRRTSVRVTTNVAQVIAAYCATIPYTGVDIFIAMLVLHTCGQFQNLNRKLTRLMDEADGTRKSSDIQKELTWIVKRHEHLNWTGIKIGECFSILLFLQMLLSTVEICFQGFLFFNVILKDENGFLTFQMLFFILFVLFITVHMYVYCYVGELLLVQSSSLGIAAYESKWYNVAPSDAKCLLFIILRSTRPIYLKAGKFGIFSMEMFSSVLRTSAGYLSVLLAMRE